jgi:hypothetical protein
MNTETKKALPAELPADPKGFTKNIVVHFNYGPDGGSAIYKIKDPDGKELPITYQYDTRKKGAAPTGLFIDGVDQCFKRWSELTAYWPEYIKSITPA